MSQLTALKPVVGPPAERDDQYFPRPHIIKKIHRLMSQGGHLLVSAPRRIGKTSLLRYIQNHPKQGQIIKYLVVQSVDSSEVFFRKLYSELIRDDEIYNGVGGYLKRASHAVMNRLSRLRGVSLEGGIEIDAQDNIDYFHECYELIRDLSDKKVIIILDEFPDALNNIAKKDRDQAIHFLQQNRDLRLQFSHDNVQFIYTGSTGLRNVVQKIGETNLINDINEITVKPFSYNEAKQLIQRLILGYQQYEAGFNLSDSQIETILQRITWRLPFYLQAILQSLFDLYEDNQTPIRDLDIEEAFINMTKAKSPYCSYFENWIHRLKKAFNTSDFELAMDILNYCAINNSLDKDILRVQHPDADYKYIRQTLDYDGYLNEAHRFNSRLLQQWWIKNVID